MLILCSRIPPQVLSDPEKRRRYDTHGLDALSDTPMMGAGEVFAMLFGDAKFDHLIGQVIATDCH